MLQEHRISIVAGQSDSGGCVWHQCKSDPILDAEPSIKVFVQKEGGNRCATVCTSRQKTWTPSQVIPTLVTDFFGNNISTLFQFVYP